MIVFIIYANINTLFSIDFELINLFSLDFELSTCFFSLSSTPFSITKRNTIILPINGRTDKNVIEQQLALITWYHSKSINHLKISQSSNIFNSRKCIGYKHYCSMYCVYKLHWSYKLLQSKNVAYRRHGTSYQLMQHGAHACMVRLKRVYNYLISLIKSIVLLYLVSV